MCKQTYNRIVVGTARLGGQQYIRRIPLASSYQVCYPYVNMYCNRRNRIGPYPLQVLDAVAATIATTTGLPVKKGNI